MVASLVPHKQQVGSHPLVYRGGRGWRVAVPARGPRDELSCERWAFPGLGSVCAWAGSWAWPWPHRIAPPRGPAQVGGHNPL